MNIRNLKYLLAPFGVATGVAVFITVSSYIAAQFGITRLSPALSFVPPSILTSLGIGLIVVWLPVFISGIFALDRRGAVGQSETLRTEGIYHYVRNPMYGGISFTIIGLGFVLNNGGVVLAGMLWLVLAVIQCKREEKELKARFGYEYINYMNAKPMLFPRFIKMVKDKYTKRSKQKNDVKEKT